jgi:hypothetical protein
MIYHCLNVSMLLKNRNMVVILKVFFLHPKSSEYHKQQQHEIWKRTKIQAIINSLLNHECNRFLKKLISQWNFDKLVLLNEHCSILKIYHDKPSNISVQPNHHHDVTSGVPSFLVPRVDWDPRTLTATSKLKTDYSHDHECTQDLWLKQPQVYSGPLTQTVTSGFRTFDSNSHEWTQDLWLKQSRVDSGPLTQTATNGLRTFDSNSHEWTQDLWLKQPRMDLGPLTQTATNGCRTFDRWWEWLFTAFWTLWLHKVCTYLFFKTISCVSPYYSK